MVVAELYNFHRIIFIGLFLFPGANMDTSPTLSIGGSRARAALLTTSGTGTGSTDRRVVFLASQPTVGSSHETKTWPHHWSPHTVCTALFYDRAFITSRLSRSRDKVTSFFFFRANFIASNR